MVKYALLVGLNYPDEEKLELNASYNDVLAVEKFLIEQEGFDNDHILILTDKKIGDNKESLNTNFFSIVRRMKEMVALSNKKGRRRVKQVTIGGRKKNKKRRRTKKKRKN